MADISNPPPLDDLEFRGGPDEDVSRFLGAIRRTAILQGRHSDEGWMRSYIESCLRGDAMEWFMGTDVDAMDWRTLSKAFLRRFHRPEPSTSMCRVKVVRSDGTVASYPPPSGTSGSSFTFIASVEEALVLDIPRVCYTTQALPRIRTVARSKAYPFLWLEEHGGAWSFRECNAGPDESVFKSEINTNTDAFRTVRTLDRSTEEPSVERSSVLLQALGGSDWSMSTG
ncbi:hypothetical protein FRB94_001104 [Tulasnella sp. JGI-2019a]|nr:hypothetical protein FRB94_001104 [Tulasnella sp. JGI-2019a]